MADNPQPPPNSFKIFKGLPRKSKQQQRPSKANPINRCRTVVADRATPPKISWWRWLRSARSAVLGGVDQFDAQIARRVRCEHSQQLHTRSNCSFHDKGTARNSRLTQASNVNEPLLN